jgi:type II secretory pathway predicted ATPase ExeA
MVMRPDLSQFAQRVAASYHLAAMDQPTVRDYIRHRLEVAGADYGIFQNSAVELIHEVTRGVPRLVNQLCDLSMVYAFTMGLQHVHRSTVQQVIEDGVFFGGGLAVQEDAIIFRRSQA